MAAGAIGPDGFGDQDGRWAHVDRGAQFVASGEVDAVEQRFLIPDDAAGDVPAGAIELVVAPGEEGAAAVVLDEEVDVDEGHDAADEEEDFLGKALARVADGGFEGGDGLLNVHGEGVVDRLALRMPSGTGTLVFDSLLPRR